MSGLPKVTDHAVLRYLERAKGMDIPAIRRHIADLVKRGVEHEGVKFVLSGERVVTVLDRRWHTEKRVEGGDA